jgi:enoyl-CoA hydratase/carnithine racemase
VEDHGDYSILKLNRPKANALDPALLKALREQVKAVERDEKKRGLILTGRMWQLWLNDHEGQDKFFSAGLDLPIMSQLSRNQMEEW